LLARDADSSQPASEGGGTDAEAPAREAGAVEAFGFNLHASVRIDAVDDRGRERLCRYGARPPFSLASADVTNLAPNILSVRHWSRLLNGVLYATSPRVRWPQLLQRTFDVDILECPKCHGRIQVVEAVLEKDAVRSILERLDLPVDAPRLVRAREPTTLDGEEPDAP
jgi:hypothetical protein